jgi:hypothetical protein
MRDTAQVMAPARAHLFTLGALSCALLACGEQVLVAHVASEQRAQSDSLQREPPVHAQHVAQARQK